MGQTATTIRMGAELKTEFDKLCGPFGMQTPRLSYDAPSSISRSS